MTIDGGVSLQQLKPSAALSTYQAPAEHCRILDKLNCRKFGILETAHSVVGRKINISAPVALITL